MPPRRAIDAARTSGQRWLWGRDSALDIEDLRHRTCFGGQRASLLGKSVMIMTDGQVSAAAALMELDRLTARLLICPPDIKPDYLPVIARQAGIDVVITAGQKSSAMAASAGLAALSMTPPEPSEAGLPTEIETDWLLLTSGTSGVPKIVRHTFASLTSAIKPEDKNSAPVWGTFYDIRRYAGLQIFLRALVGTGSMVLSDAREPLVEFLPRLAKYGATHISGTPTHWRRVLMNWQPNTIAPSYVRLSGEIADQKILDDLKEAFPKAAVAHAYASTEAGVGFAVNDGLEGFPRTLLDDDNSSVQMKIVDGTLRIKSPGVALDYVRGDTHLRDEDGFVDTGDIVESNGNRYYFAGRRSGIINVGGMKVHPEEIESIINRHRAVQMSLVKSRKNPFTGFIVVADVILRDNADAAGEERIRTEIMAVCREALPQYKVPALLRFVPQLDIAESGKLVRAHA
jgi:acyl-CoA synthetase (AMP-forming)/AMP-acid ligase II